MNEKAGCIQTSKEDWKGMMRRDVRYDSIMEKIKLLFLYKNYQQNNDRAQAKIDSWVRIVTKKK